MRKLILLTLVAAVIINYSFCEASTFSATYKIKVELPAVIGLNMPFNQERSAQAKQSISSADTMTILEQVIIRDDREILIKTTVLK